MRGRDGQTRDQTVLNICCVLVCARTWACVCLRVCGASYLSLCGLLNMTSCHLGSHTQGGSGGGRQPRALRGEKKKTTLIHLPSTCHGASDWKALTVCVNKVTALSGPFPRWHWITAQPKLCERVTIMQADRNIMEKVAEAEKSALCKNSNETSVVWVTLNHKKPCRCGEHRQVRFLHRPLSSNKCSCGSVQTSVS